MERRVNYLLVAAFSLIMAAGFVGFVLWAHNRGSGKLLTSYAIFFNHAVSGLPPGGLVTYLGVPVGHVASLELDSAAKPPRVRVGVDIDSSIPIDSATIAQLKPSGITGVVFVDLRNDPAAKPAPLNKTADGLPIIPSEMSGFDKILAGAAGSADHLEALMAHLQMLFRDENIRRMDATIAHIEQATGSIAAHQEEIDALFKDASGAARSLNAMLDTLNRQGTGDHIAHLAEDLNKTAANLEKTSAGIAAHQNSIDEFAGPGLHDLRETIRDSHDTADTITELGRSLNDNPSQLLYPPNSQGVRIDP